MSKEKSNELNEILRENLEKLTGEKSQVKIAEKIDVQAPTLSRWLSGQSLPATADLIRISEKYKCSIDWLLGNDLRTENKCSIYDICKALTEIDKCAPFEIGTVTEYDVSEVDELGNIEKIDQESYSAIYYKNSIGKECRYNCSSGQIIGEFIKAMNGLKEALSKKYMNMEIYLIALDHLLDELPRDPIEYSTPEELMDLPFD